MSARTVAAAIFAVIGLPVIFAPGEAFADLITAHLTGTFASGSVDSFGYFGTAGADLSGQTFSFLETYAPAGSGITDSDTATSQSISTTAGLPFEESLTVGGNTVTLATVTSGLVTFSASQALVSLKVGGVGNVAAVKTISASFSSSIGYSEGFLDTQSGFNSVLSGIETPPGGGFFGFKLQGSSGSNTDTLTIASITGTSATPEPSSLALYGAALLGLGFFRRRNQV